MAINAIYSVECSMKYNLNCSMQVPNTISPMACHEHDLAGSMRYWYDSAVIKLVEKWLSSIIKPLKKSQTPTWAQKLEKWNGRTVYCLI